MTFEEFVMAVINRLKMSMLSRISKQSLPELFSLNLQVLPLQRNARTTGGFLHKHEESNNCVSQVEYSSREEFKNFICQCPVILHLLYYYYTFIFLQI